LRRKVHDCLEEVVSNWVSMNVMRSQMADMELAHGALRAKVNGLAPMVIDLTDDEVEVRVEEEEIVISGLEPIVLPLEWNGHWGQGVLETSENIWRTLQDVVQIAHNVIAQYM
jgi:hypothetical protein